VTNTCRIKTARHHFIRQLILLRYIVQPLKIIKTTLTLSIVVSCNA